MTEESVVLQRVNSCLAAGDIMAAIDTFESAAADNSTTEFLLEYAKLLWQCYQFADAEITLRQIVHRSDTPTETIQFVAKMYFSVGKFSAAAEIMQNAVAGAAGHRVECLNQLASCLERSNQKERARDVALEALHEAPASAQAARLLGHLDKRAGDFQSAIDRLTGQLKKYPSQWDWSLRYELAASLDRVGQYNEAWQQLTAAKAQLAATARPQLAQSMSIRARQAEFAKGISDADLKRWHSSTARLKPTRLALMAGFPRSGTTLLEQILGAHPECVGTDETGILNTQFIRPMVWEPEESFSALLELRGLNAEQLQTGRQTYLGFTESYIGEAIGDRLLIEKDPLLTADLALPLRLFPEATIIMPLRDPRDVAISYFFTMVPINWSSSPAISILETAKFYHDIVRHWLLLKQRLPWNSIETKYEDLVADSHSEARRITDFLGLDWNPQIVDSQNRSEQKAISTPTYDDVTKPIYSRAVARWKNYESQLAPALKILEPWAKQFGYE